MTRKEGRLWVGNYFRTTFSSLFIDEIGCSVHVDPISSYNAREERVSCHDNRYSN